MAQQKKIPTTNHQAKKLPNSPSSAEPATKQKQQVAKNKKVISNEVKLDVHNPIPIDTGRIGFSYLNNEWYVDFLPPYNNYAQMLLEAKMLSVTHLSCVTTKARYCGGVGFEDVDGKELDKNIITWFKSMNLKNQSAQKLSRNAFDSLFTFGNVPIEVVRFKTSAGKRLFIYVHDMQEWRLGTPDDNDMVLYAIQSKLFRTHQTYYLNKELYKSARKLPLYSPYKTEKQNWQQFADGTERTMIWYKENTLGYLYYGIPSAVSGMITQLLEYKGARYNMDNFDNNMVVSGVLALQGNLTQPEANRIGKEVISSHTGDGKRGRIQVIASEEGIASSSFHSFDTHKDGSFLSAKEIWRGDIVLANEWDSMLAGLISPSTLGKGAGFLTKTIEWKLNTVIHPQQRDMMDEVWTLVFSIAQQWLNLPFDNYELKFKNNIDISGLTDVDITPAVTVNEVRQAKGLPKLPEGGDVLMNAKAPAPDNGNGAVTKEGA
jgi:hypothetical protein